MKPYACLTVCLLLALAVVLTPSPGASAFSIHLGSSGSYAGGLGAPSPRADSLHEAWRKPLASTFWRRRRRGSTSGSPGSSGAEMSPLNSNWGFGAADDEGSEEAKHWKMAKLKKLHAERSRALRPNEILRFSTTSKLHMRDPFEEAAASSSFSKALRKPSSIENKHQGWNWQKTTSKLRNVMPGLETSSTDDGWSKAGVEDFEDVATKIREAIDILAESERVREKAEEEDQEEEYGARAELPAGPVPAITLFPTHEHIPARPVQSGEPARRHEDQSEKGEHPTLLQTVGADSNDPLMLVNKAASKPSASESLGLGTRMAPPRASFSDWTGSDFESLFLADPKSSKGNGRDLFSDIDIAFGSPGGKFDNDNSACEDIDTKTCFSDADCSCYGYYRCQDGRCDLRSKTHSSDLSGSVGDFSEFGQWAGSRKKRQQPAHPTSAATKTTAAATKSIKAGKEHVAADHSDSHTAAPHSLRKRKAQAGSDVNAVHAARAAADIKGVKRRAPTGGPSRQPTSRAQ